MREWLLLNSPRDTAYGRTVVETSQAPSVDVFRTLSTSRSCHMRRPGRAVHPRTWAQNILDLTQAVVIVFYGLDKKFIKIVLNLSEHLGYD